MTDKNSALSSKTMKWPQFVERLKQRAEWLRKEYLAGGSFEHLSAREQECTYITGLAQEIVSAEPSAHETLAPPARRHSRDCDCHDCHYSKKHPQVKPHHARCGCFECAPRGPVETNDIARDAARYRFLRQPGNAIVYAKDRDAWGRNASGHVRYDTAEQLDAAVDAASNAVKASETSEDARLAESVTGFLEHAEKHGLQTEDQLAESQLTKANEPAPPPTDEGARLQPTGSASGTEWKGMGGGAAVRCPHGVVVENPRDWLGWSFCEKCPDCIATWKDEGSPLLLTKRRIREIARHCNPTLTGGEFAAMWMTWMLAGPP